MTPFTVLRSRPVPLLDPDVDTDQIIPAQYVNASGQAALADALFRRRRDQEPGFVFNRPEIRGRAILLAGPNFGCGSSREAAAWALRAWGIRALIGPSFNATFYANCLQNGLLPVPLADALPPGGEITIDLAAGTLATAERIFPIQIEAFARELLTRGIDELQYLLDRRAEIAAYEERR